MSETRRRANQAMELMASTAFTDICAQIRDEAARLFLDANSGIEEIGRAHERVRAVQVFLDALQGRVDDLAVEAKRDQDHVND